MLSTGVNLLFMMLCLKHAKVQIHLYQAGVLQRVQRHNLINSSLNTRRQKCKDSIWEPVCAAVPEVAKACTKLVNWSYKSRCSSRCTSKTSELILHVQNCVHVNGEEEATIQLIVPDQQLQLTFSVTFQFDSDTIRKRNLT